MTTPEDREERTLKRRKRVCRTCRHWRTDETLAELAEWALALRNGWHLCGDIGIPMGPYCRCDRWEKA